MKKLFVLVALIATIIPAVFVIHEAGGLQNWQGVLPRGSTDSLYYYGRIREVVDGYPLIGNPYAYEHREAYSPAFFLPDIVSAVPLYVGIPFPIAIMLNMFVWSLVFLLLSFKLLRLLRVPKNSAFFWAVATFVGSYSLVLRPTIMQVVFPVFLAFLIAIINFLYEPLVRRKMIWLSVTAAATFYVYTYLSYIALLVFVFLLCWFLFTRRFKEVRSLLTAGIISAVLVVPFGVYTLMQMKGPYYLETFYRIGLIYTHIPAIEAFYFGRWIVIGLIAFWLLWRYFPKNYEKNLERKIFWIVTGLALFVSLFLNVITGVDLWLATHIGRFVIIWMTVILAVLIHEWLDSRTEKTQKIKYVAVAFILILLAYGVARNISFTRSLAFFNFNHRDDDIADTQSYAAPLKWLEDNVKEESVIWANDLFGEYIPIMTRHYPLFADGALFHSISSKELEDRFLLSRSLRDLDSEDIERDFKLYPVTEGNKIQAMAERREGFCEITERFFSSTSCISEKEEIALKMDQYFETLEQRFNLLKKDQNKNLKKYKVKYLIIDRERDNLKNISTDKKVYDDGRFVILPLSF